MNIEGKFVVLKAIEPSDLARLQQWANDPALQRQLGGWHFPTSSRDQQAWLDSLSCQSAHQRFGIHAGELGLVGTANLVSIDWKNRSAFHGLLIGESTARGRGLGVDTVMALMRHAFDELGMARLDTDIIEYNQASLSLHAGKCGWVVEGEKQDAYYRDGRYWKKLILGITASQYRDKASATGYWT